MNIRQAAIKWLFKSTAYNWHSIGLSAPPGATWNPSEHAVRAYSDNAIAYACISRIAKDVAGVPLLFLSNPDDETSYVADSDPVAALFARPNEIFTTRRLIEWTTMMRMLRGECFWKLEYGRGNLPVATQPWFDPIYWREEVSKDDGLLWWEYMHGQLQFKAAPEDVLWVGNNNPANPYRGVSPLRAAAAALGIDNHADTLQGDTVSRGGERGLLMKTEIPLDKEQIDQHRVNLAQRRPGKGQASRDVILPYGLELSDPKFTREDLKFIEMQTAAKKKICHVFGMAPILIGDDDSAQYQSAPHAIKMYWRQTVVPLLRSYEDSWDHFFTQKRGLKTFVRFDISAVEALREDDQVRAETARIYSSVGIPLAVLNERLDLGFSDEDMVAADQAREARREAAANMWSLNENGERLVKAKGLTNEMIRKRSMDANTKMQRERALNRLGMSTRSALVAVGADFAKRAKAAIEATGLPPEMAGNAAALKIRDLEPELREAVLEAVEPAHRKAAEIGAVSIQDLVTGKAHEPWHDRRKNVSFNPIIDEAFATRRRLTLLVVAHWIDDMATWVVDVAKEVAESGEAIGTLSRMVEERFTQYIKSNGQTIARTEVGTMYNVARFAEMGEQGFDKHEWLTNIDEATRESHMIDGQVRRINDEFSNGLLYPQENGKPAEEVINCRCETLPVVE